MSLDEEAITQQRALLTQNRRRLAVLLQQQARLGDYTPPHIQLEIEDIQGAIRTLKADLHKASVAVEDAPEDEARPATGAVPWRLFPADQRNRSRMLDRVETCWIKGVLEQSLYQVARIELGLVYDLDAVTHPWESVVQQPNQPNHPIPPGQTVVEVFDSFGGELLLLGHPGSGKTTLLLELARDLIDRARQSEQQQIPVVFNLATWATKRQALHQWFVEELNERYDVPRKVAQAWVVENAILPLLDGLDEVAGEQRVACVDAINVYRRERGFVPLAVCSRAEEYAALTEKLRLAGAIVIQPLTKEQVDAYLKPKAFAGVRALLRDDVVLRELLDTPLVLSIVALTYKDTAPAKLRAGNAGAAATAAL